MPPKRKSPAARRPAAGPAAAWGGITETPTPPPEDVAYPGVIALHVDASDTAQGIFRVQQTVPVRVGKLVLLYPKWLPGNHSPTGPIDKLAGLEIRANGRPLAWSRNAYDVYAFHVDVPAGVSRLDVRFQYLSARTRGEGPVEMTDAMLDLVWSKVSLYPAGHFTRHITFAPRVTLPAGWGFGTALETQSKSGARVRFKPVAYDTLVDSPIYAGRHFKRIDLAPGAKVPVHMAMVADAPRYLEASEAQLQPHRSLVTQATRLFGAQHYDHYDFLVSLSDVMSPKGLEHHQSSEDGVHAAYFTDWQHGAPRRDLLAHEYTHSWNGKFRRPADLATPNFNVPMSGSLLWVYEGQTQYWGFVLTARAGLWTPGQFCDALAQVAARYDRGRPGFGWRTLADTTNDPVIARRAALPYRNWQMSEEYYSAGQLLWLTVDAKIRALTDGRRALDHFAKRFFGVGGGSFATRPYVFEDVVDALERVVSHRWAGFLRARIDAHKPPLDGLAAAGWKLAYTDTASDFEQAFTRRYHVQSGLMYSLGLALGKDGTIGDVRWDGPAQRAGVTSGATLVAVDGLAWKPGVLTDALKAGTRSKAPLELLLKFQDRYRSVPVDYHGGLQYPHLVRVEGKPDYLSQIIKAR